MAQYVLIVDTLIRGHIGHRSAVVDTVRPHALQMVLLPLLLLLKLRGSRAPAQLTQQ